MEYYPYSLLSLIKKRNKPFSFKDIVVVGYNIANGLSYLHRQEPPVIHRDLKSGNILLSKDVNDEIVKVKITDFDASAITSYARLNLTVIGTV